MVRSLPSTEILRLRAQNDTTIGHRSRGRKHPGLIADLCARIMYEERDNGKQVPYTFIITAMWK